MKTITKDELAIKIKLHQKWLNNEEWGERLELVGYDLSRSNLSRSNLSRSNLSRSNLSCSDLSCSNLSRSDLSGSNLSGSDLSGSDLDYSCLPLWCGSLNAHFDDRQIFQIVYHAVKAGLDSPNVSENVKSELRKVAGLANRFHRVDECGRIEVSE